MATCIMTLGFLIGEFLSNEVASAFTTDKTLIDLSAQGLRIVVIFFPIVGFQMVTSNFFQSIGMAGKAIFLSLTRQLLFLLPCLLILPQIYGVKGVWYSMPSADLAASVVSVFMLVSQYRKFKIREEEKVV